MTHNKVSVLRWHKRLEDQHHRKAEDKQMMPIFSATSNMPPFHLVREATNNTIKSFKLVNLLDESTEIDIYSEMITAGLNVWNDGNENYDNSGLSDQFYASDTSAWGMSFAPDTRKFRYLQIHLNFYDAGNIPENFRCVVMDGKGGAELGTVDMNIGTQFGPSDYLLTFDFGEVIESLGAPTAMWVEVRSDGYIRPWGKDGVSLDYTPVTETHGLSTGDLTVSPSTDIGSPGDYDAYVRTWGENYEFDLIRWSAAVAFSVATEQGKYYCIMKDQDAFGNVVNTWYSEVFCIVDDLSQFIKVTFWHRYDFHFDGGAIIYSNGFRNFFYVNSEIGRPLYPVVNSIREVNGIKQKIHQTSIKVFRFEMLAHEYFLDMLRIVGMHHDVVITSFLDEYTVNDFLMTPQWLDPGVSLAKVTIEFRTNSIVVQAGDNVAPLPDPVQSGLWTAPNGGFWWDPDGEGWST